MKNKSIKHTPLKHNLTALSQQKFTLSKQNAWLLLCCQLINMSCLWGEIRTWMLGIIALCFGWRILLLNNESHHIQSGEHTQFTLNARTSTKSTYTVSPLLLTTIAISGCLAIAISAKTLGVLLSMVHLLIFAYTLKAFEIKQRKDLYQLVLLGLFLLASALIFKQSLAFTTVILLALVVNLAVLQKVFTPNKTSAATTKTIFILTLQSTLLAVVLFLFFPRVSPFWQVPNATSAKTGLSDEVKPGDIANLALSSDLAFRVNFQGNDLPPYDELYWRAMTLENYDGVKWSRTKLKDPKKATKSRLKIEDKLPALAKSITYNVITEPSYQSWLFGLAVATSRDTKLRLMYDYTIQSRNILSQLSHYQLKSYLKAPLDLTIEDTIKQRNLALVLGSNPQLEKLGNKLRKQLKDPRKISNAVLSTFREKQYFYTLKPTLLNNNSLDQFFFNTKAGFCVHFASSYTYLMRAAGVPARVVTGYLGGEYNRFSASQNENNKPLQNSQKGHLSVYQYDAHAWAEIWLEGIGWQRVDPTSAVDPERVESGWSDALLEQKSFLSNQLISLYQFKNITWLNTLRLQLDALDYQWTRWVLGYSSKQQYDLIKRWFGKYMPWKSAAIVFFALFVTFVIFTLVSRINFHWLKHKKIKAHIKIYNKVLKQLEKKGIVKLAHETPSDFSIKVGLKLPELANDFHLFTKTLECFLYNDLNTAQQEEKLLQLKVQGNTLKTTVNKKQNKDTI